MVFFSTLAGSLVKAAVFAILAYTGIRLGKRFRDYKDQKKQSTQQGTVQGNADPSAFPLLFSKREFNSSKIKKYLSGRIGSGFFKSTNLSYYIVFYSIL